MSESLAQSMGNTVQGHCTAVSLLMQLPTQSTLIRSSCPLCHKARVFTTVIIVFHVRTSTLHACPNTNGRLCVSLHHLQSPVGAVIVNFQTGQVAARGFSSRGHPTKHAVMMCIDKVALAQGGGVWHDHASSSSLEPPAKRSKQNKEYLCTGLQLFITAEPCVM